MLIGLGLFWGGFLVGAAPRDLESRWGVVGWVIGVCGVPFLIGDLKSLPDPIYGPRAISAAARRVGVPVWVALPVLYGVLAAGAGLLLTKILGSSEW